MPICEVSSQASREDIDLMKVVYFQEVVWDIFFTESEQLDCWEVLLFLMDHFPQDSVEKSGLAALQHYRKVSPAFGLREKPQNDMIKEVFYARVLLIAIQEKVKIRNYQRKVRESLKGFFDFVEILIAGVEVQIVIT